MSAGYPVHAVSSFRRWSNQHGGEFTDWAAVCGARGVKTGHGQFLPAGNARRKELCRSCFSGRDWDGYFPDPTDTTESED